MGLEEVYWLATIVSVAISIYALLKVNAVKIEVENIDTRIQNIGGSDNRVSGGDYHEKIVSGEVTQTISGIGQRVAGRDFIDKDSK